MPAFIRSAVPDAPDHGHATIQRILLDQDTGGAIRASGRCDIYMGIGPEAQAMAGQELQQGDLYYLALSRNLCRSRPTGYSERRSNQ